MLTSFKAIFFSVVAYVFAGDGVGPSPGQIKNLVTFGDSYTDIAHLDRGTPWPIYASGFANVKLFPFAKSGATCSNNITYRPFPSLFESQLPAYFKTTSEKGPGFLNPAQTIYTLWLGTNDVGVNALLTGSDKASLVDVTTCMTNWVERLYDSGARNFLFQNMIPLETVPLYAPASYPNHYWNRERNTTEWTLAPTLQGAQIGIFDSHSLFADMFAHPELYLNGTAPLNVTGAVDSCVYPLNGHTKRCTTATGDDRDSFLWFDELHPSEQANRIVAREIAQVIVGQKNKWTTWLI